MCEVTRIEEVWAQGSHQLAWCAGFRVFRLLARRPFFGRNGCGREPMAWTGIVKLGQLEPLIHPSAPTKFQDHHYCRSHFTLARCEVGCVILGWPGYRLVALAAYAIPSRYRWGVVARGWVLQYIRVGLKDGSFFFSQTYSTCTSIEASRSQLSIALFFSAAELIQDFYRQITSLLGISQSLWGTEMTACNECSQQR